MSRGQKHILLGGKRFGNGNRRWLNPNRCRRSGHRRDDGNRLSRNLHDRYRLEHWCRHHCDIFCATRNNMNLLRGGCRFEVFQRRLRIAQPILAIYERLRESRTQMDLGLPGLQPQTPPHPQSHPETGVNEGKKRPHHLQTQSSSNSKHEKETRGVMRTHFKKIVIQDLESAVS